MEGDDNGNQEGSPMLLFKISEYPLEQQPDGISFATTDIQDHFQINSPILFVALIDTSNFTSFLVDFLTKHLNLLNFKGFQFF